MLEDHLACPALERWIPDLVGEHAHVWTAPGTRPPRVVVRLLESWSPVPDDGSVLPALVVATSLQPELPLHLPAALLERVRPGALVLDLASLTRPSLGSLWRPGRRRTAIMFAAADRVRTLADGGLVDVEQWVSLDPSSILVTLGFRRGCVTVAHARSTASRQR